MATNYYTGVTTFDDVLGSFDWSTGKGTGLLSGFDTSDLWGTPKTTSSKHLLSPVASIAARAASGTGAPTALGNDQVRQERRQILQERRQTTSSLGNMATLKIPTAQEMEDILSTKSLGGKWDWLNEYLGKIGGNPLIQQQIYPVLQGALRGLYNKGMGSSSFADRAVRELAQKYDPSQYITGSNNILDLILNTAKSASAT